MLLDLRQSEPVRPKEPIQLSPTVRNDVFLNAILDMPTTKRPRRSPLKWAGAAALHIGLVAVLIIVPLYTTATIHLTDYDSTLLVAPPPPPPPPPLARAAIPQITHLRGHFTYKIPKLVAPTSIPKKVAKGAAAEPPPPLENLTGNIRGEVAGGQIDGVLGGVLGGVGTGAAPHPPSQPVAARRIIRAGSGVKPPRQRYNVDPVYPPLALQARIYSTVVIEALIDEHGNVVRAGAISGHPLLIPAALSAVLQWKYEPTSLNGEPVSVELQVRVSFNPHKGE